MAQHVITFDVDTECLCGFTDAYIAQLWHIGQANPAPFGDAHACDLAEHVGREIVRRWLCEQTPELWAHQGRHAAIKAPEAPAPTTTSGRA